MNTVIYIDGVPLYMSPVEVDPMFTSLNAISNLGNTDALATSITPENIKNNPLGKESVFHTVAEVYSEQEIIDTYTHRIIWCKSGVDVFSHYQSKDPKYTPKPKELLIFYEENPDEASNFFGTACRVKMGAERRVLMEKVYKNRKTITLKNKEANSLKVWSLDMATWHNKLEASVLESAIIFELQEITAYNNIINTIFGINETLADWITSGVSALDDVKFTDKNYDYKEYGEKLEPIIPIHLYKKTYQFLTQGGPQPYDVVKQKGLAQLTNVVSNFDDFVFGIAKTVVAATPNKKDDILLATIIKVKQYLQEHLGKVLEKLFNKLKQFMATIKAKIEDFIDQIDDNLLLLNAFLCGLINGILSIVQAILSIVALVVDNVFILNINNYSANNLAKHQEKLEFIEDAIDLLIPNLDTLFLQITTQMLTIQKELFKLVLEVWQLAKQQSKYFWAYCIGGVVFEFIVEAIITLYTGGSAAFAKAAAKINRISSQLTQKGKTVVKGFGKTVAKNTAELLQYLKKELVELIEAIKNGKLIAYLKRKFFELIDNKEGLRKLYLQKWLHKFDDNFINHISGDVGNETISIFFKELFYVSTKGEGGHWLNKFLKVDEIIYPPGVTNISQIPDDLPFKAKVIIKSKKGRSFPKETVSSMFPKNWSIKRIQEEVSYIYENTVVNNNGFIEKNFSTGISKYRAISTNGFKIQIEIKNKNIINAYPYLN